MGRITNRLRTSLALRVLLSTILLSSAVIWLSGSILDSRVAAGVKQVNLDSAINEARSTIVGARYRLILAKSGSPKEIDALINEIVSSATTVGARASGRELVLLRGPLVNPVEKDFTTTSNLVDPQSLPKEFRENAESKSELLAFAVPITAQQKKGFVVQKERLEKKEKGKSFTGSICTM